MVLLLLAAPMSAQVVIHKTLTVEDGLVQSNINAIYEDKEGFLWFATMDGVSRWDGINFVNFQTHNGLTASQIYDIYEDEDGSIYFPTYGGGLCRFKNGRMEQVFPEIARADSDLAALRKDDLGNFYLGGYRGISRIDTAGQVELIDSSHAVWVMEKGRNNTLYFGTYKTGIKILKEGTWTVISKKDGLIDNAVWRITEASDGALYVGTNHGVNVLRDGQISYLGDKCKFLDCRTIAIYEDHAGGMYFGSMKGVVYKKGNHWKRFTEENGLTANDIWSVYEDSYGTVYFGTGGAGVCIYRPGLIENYTKQSGLGDNIVRSVYEDKTGAYWFATDVGVSILNKGKMRYLTKTHGLTGNRVRKIVGDATGKIYIGTRSGLNIWEHGRLTRLTEEQGLIDNQILSLLVGHDETLYVCTRKGISILRNGQIKSFDKNNGMVDDYVTCAAEDDKGNVYFGTYLGVAILTDQGWDTLSLKDGLADNKILAIHQDRRGYFYFGSYGGGLSIQTETGMQVLGIQDGLSSNTIWSIQEDDNGNIYLATGKGVNVLSWQNDSLKIRYIRHADGLASDEHNRDASFKDSKGRLWFGTGNGVSCYDPAADQPISKAPRLHLLSVNLFDRDIAPMRNTFCYDENYLDFEYIGIYLPAPEKVVYRYRLVGMEDDWKVTKERHAHYTNLNSGQYIFEVQAGNEWGYWSAPLRYAFTISPPWWGTWWFRLAFIAALLMGIWQLYRIRVSHLLQVERLRSRIASDLHDDVGSMLTRIFQGSEIVQITKDPEKINTTARRIGQLTRETAQIFSDIIWSIEAQNDTVGNLIDRMQDLSYQLLGTMEIMIDFTVNGLERNKALEGSKRQHIYLIYKEALNNIAKYAQARQVQIRLMNDRKRFVMEIKDDGIGLTESTRSGGHGLKSMRRRAEQLGGVLHIKSNGGTTIRLEMEKI